MTVVTSKDGTQVADFQFGFALEGKAVDITPQDDGTVIVEGYAADFDLDRQEEAFEPGAFEQGLKAYLDSNPILLYHHKSDTALGQVESATIDGKGMFVRARVDAPEPGTIIADYVRKIKAGTLRAFSVGGKFYRRMTANGPRIFRADIGEISITPYPVNPRTLFAVAGKAFESAPEADEADLEPLAAALARIESNLKLAEGKASGHPDAHRVATLLSVAQKFHTLAEDTHQNAKHPDVKAAADEAAASAKKHAAKLHRVAAKIGPLPPPSEFYG